MKVQLEEGLWLGDGKGSPPTTPLQEYAKDFDTISKAAAALEDARKCRPFEKAQFVDDVHWL